MIIKKIKIKCQENKLKPQQKIKILTIIIINIPHITVNYRGPQCLFYSQKFGNYPIFV